MDDNGITIFMGKPISYWKQLERMVKEHNLEKIMDELMLERAKVTYYEMILDRVITITTAKPHFSKGKDVIR